MWSHRRFPRVAAAHALAVGALACPPALAAAALPEPLALVNANVIDVRTGRVTPHATLVFRDGKIASVGGGAAPAGVKVVDLKGKYVLPGLIDCHTHLSTLAAARLALESGVTTVRSSGVSNYARNRGRHMLPRLRDTVPRAHRLGIRVATGADTSYGPNSLTRIPQEVAAFVEMGFTPLEALQAATTVAAELLRVERTTGPWSPASTRTRSRSRAARWSIRSCCRTCSSSSATDGWRWTG